MLSPSLQPFVPHGLDEVQHEGLRIRARRDPHGGLPRISDALLFGLSPCMSADSFFDLRRPK